MGYADKSQETLISLASLTGLSTNGSYTVLKEKGANPVVVLSSTVTQGKTFEVSPTDGDYHCLTATDLQTYKRVSGAWVETQYVPIGTTTVASGVISVVTTNDYNRNGYDTSEASFPSNKYIDLTLGASGSAYTAPADGYLLLAKKAGVAGQYAYLANINSNISTGGAYVSLNFDYNLYIPMRKGEIAVITYNLSGITDTFKFIYAEGSKP